jgi:hypothetical protein
MNFTDADMKKVRFDDAPTLAAFKEDPSEIIPLEDWLVDEHVCVQKPDPERDWGGESRSIRGGFASAKISMRGPMPRNTPKK